MFLYLFISELSCKVKGLKRDLYCPGQNGPLRTFPHFEPGHSMITPAECQNILQGHKLTVSFFGLQPHIVYGRDGQVTGGDLETIKAIANEMGFNTTEAFSKSFYKSTGIYPSFFIKQLEKQ